MGYIQNWTRFYERFISIIRLDVRFLPALSLVTLLYLLDMTAITFPIIGALKAHFTLMAIFYWSIYRPTLMPVWLIGILGLCIDAVSGLPLGLNTGTLALAGLLVVNQRRFLSGQHFTLVWLGFCGLCALFLTAQWGLMSILTLQWIPISPIIISYLLSILLFPLVVALLFITHKLLPAPSKTYGTKSA